MSQQSSPLELDGYVSASPADMPAHYALSGKILVGVIVIFFLVIFFILISHVYAKWFWSASSNRRGVAFTSTRCTHIHTGLQKTVVAQLPNFIYKAPSSSAEAGDGTRSLECAVCLSEFQENEKGRMLPSCKHTFHTQCIDMWFFSHSTCPLCRASVMPASTAASSGMPSSHEQHGGEEQVAIEASQNTTEGRHVALSPVQYPCNVLFWGNEAQETSSQDPSSSSSPSSSLPLFTPPTRSLPQIIIDIPPTEGISVASTAGSLSSKSTSHTTKQVACSSQTPESPGLCASIKRMLSRQSSRHRSSSQEGSEESPQ